MATVQTISGPVESSDLGWTLSHEHLASGMAGMERIGLYDEGEALRRCLNALGRAHDAGVRSLIDCTVLDLGRQVSLLERLADRTPVHIVAATGVYRSVPLSYYSWSPDTLAGLFLREILEGMEGTSVRAGIIKIAWDVEYGIEEGGSRSPKMQLEKVARAAARAAREAGVPVTCHTRPRDRHGLRLLDIFEEEELDPRAVTIGHTNDSDDLDYVLELARRGATVGLDRYMRIDEAEAERRAAVALELIRTGFAEQVCLGHDAAAFSANMGPPEGGPRPEDPDCWLRVPNFEVPWLRDHGASEDDIDAVTRRSVQATFEAAAKGAVGGGIR